ncbi:o-succinylbenzoate synthase [Gleimia hominis]|uniref:o-succinylbenzoate synthase n=2 Tax=Gleimia hominis TaxID=595468 RepID=A0ABU3IA42_9ACTO|nr:o-succinylbenzoate synthase [Gleimia hominis]
MTTMGEACSCDRAENQDRVGASRAAKRVMHEVPASQWPPAARRVLKGVDRVVYYSLPLRNRFRRINVRNGLLLHGKMGWAEFSPFWNYDPHESARWLAAALAEISEPPMPLQRDRVPVNVTIPVVNPDRAQRMVAQSGGCTTAKVKVADPGVPLSEDLERVAAVKQALGPHGKVRVDANAAWTVEQAVTAVKALDTAAGGLEYVEQPCATVAELAQVRKCVDVPVAADESVRRAEDPLAVARAGAADLVVVKMQPLGGTRKLLEICEQAGLPAVVSSALESSVGIARAVACAAALPQLPYACGLATAQMFTEDVCVPLRPQDGAILVEDCAPDETLIDTGERGPHEEIINRWMHRLEAIANLKSDAHGGK